MIFYYVCVWKFFFGSTFLLAYTMHMSNKFHSSWFYFCLLYSKFGAVAVCYISLVFFNNSRFWSNFALNFYDARCRFFFLFIIQFVFLSEYLHTIDTIMKLSVGNINGSRKHQFYLYRWKNGFCLYIYFARSIIKNQKPFARSLLFVVFLVPLRFIHNNHVSGLCRHGYIHTKYSTCKR